MKKWYAIPALASMAIIGMVGCSTESSSSSLTGSVSEEQNVIRVNIADARTHLAKYRRSVVESWDLSGPTADSTVTVDVDTTLQSDNFAVDADVQVEDDSTYTVASAGVDGDGAAWMIQVEGGAIVYSWRNHGNGDWHKFKTDKHIEKKTLANVRMERAGKIVVFWVNGQIIAAFKDDSGKVVQVSGKLTIGFDILVPGQCHCGNGSVEQIGVENIDEIEDTPIDSVQVIDTVETVVDTIDLTKDSVITEWVAEWDFNDAANVGLDVTGNGHNAAAGEGTVSSDSGVARFDGESGLKVSLENDIKINEFVVEARVKPTQFGTMQNIVVAEPPGRGVDGWQLRIDEGVLTVHLRDTDKDGDDWNIFPGKEMALKVIEQYPIAFENILRYAAGGKTIYKCHIMHALMDYGYTTDLYGDVYDKLFNAQTGLCAEEVRKETEHNPDVRFALELIKKELGEVMLLVNNAGLASIGLYTDLTDAELANIITTDLVGAMEVSRQVLPAMIRAKQGCIINISSVWGEKGASCEVAYSAAKAGLIGFTRALAREEAPSGIRVNCICCGYIETKMNAQLSQQDKDALLDEIPAGRFGTPNDVAQTAAFLASERSDYINGQVIRLDGCWI